MFNNLTDFKRKRTTKEAIGFYIAYFVLQLILAVGIGYILGLFSNNVNNSYELGLKMGNTVAFLGSLLLSFLIVIKKKQTGNFLYLLLAVASGILGAFGGLVLGLIPAAFLTTRKSLSSRK